MDELSDRESRAAPRGRAARGTVTPAAPVVGDDKKSRKDLLDEIADLRRKLNTKEVLGPSHKSIEGELKGTKQRLEHLLAISPTIIYTNKLSSDFPCTFVSENLQAIMGYPPGEMIGDQKCWSNHLHPEDAGRVFEEMRPLIERGGGTVEYRFQHRDGHYIWIQDTFKVVKDEAGNPSELVGAWADITERKSIETELSDTRQRLQYLLAVSPAIDQVTEGAPARRSPPRR